MKFEFLDGACLQESLTDLILELTQPYIDDFDKNDIHLFEDPSHRFGFLAVKLFNEKDSLNKKPVYIERVYFPVYLN
jgi:hypothetical protein